jgi:hypothetical protein
MAGPENHAVFQDLPTLPHTPFVAKEKKKSEKKSPKLHINEIFTQFRPLIRLPAS